MDPTPQFAVPEGHLPAEHALSGGGLVDDAARSQVARHLQQVEPHAPMTPIEANAWIDTRTLRGVLRTALLNRIEQFGDREIRQRSTQEIAFVLMAFALAALLAAPALVPLVVALRGGQL